MAVNREQLIFDVLANTSKAEGGFVTVGRKAAAASDDVGALARRLDEISKKSATARVQLEGDKDAQVKLDKLDLKLAQLGNKTARPDVTVEGAARAAVEINALDLELDHLSEKSATAGKGITSLAGLTGGNYGMAALVTAGVALSPMLVTLGVGLGGLAFAALGAGKNSKVLAQEIAPLKNDFAAFQKQLQPVVLADFAKAAGLAGNILHDIEPVTVATGKALGGVLAEVDAEFKSGTWQNFFAFMARTAGPDMQLLGSAFTNLLNLVPPLLMDLQPLAVELLKDADGAVKLTGYVVQLGTELERVGRDTYQFGQRTQDSGGFVGFLAQRVKEAFGQMVPAIPLLGHLQQKLHELGDNSKFTAAEQAQLAQAAKQADAGFVGQAKQLNILAASYVHALTPLENYIGANITEANDLHALKVALRGSGDAIGYKTQKERDSFSAAQAYIQDTIKQGDSALAAHKGIDAQITSIKNALPVLESVKGKTAAYKQELDLLKGILDKLRAEKLIQEKVQVFGNGSWSISGSGVVHGVGGHTAAPAAGGMFVTGGTPGKDSVLLRAMPGELVVPTRMVSAGLVDHLRGSIPGFAGGGIVPSYSGSPAGLPGWTRDNHAATVRALTADMASAIASAFQNTIAQASAGAPGAQGGPTSASAAQAQAYARSRLGAYGWGSSQMGPLIALWNQESGWNRFARNPTSGAYGIPQALPPGKMGAAANPPLSSAAAQINWGLGYIRSVYGSPSGAEAHEFSAGWYDGGGWLHPGATLAVNNTGKPERVLPPGASGGPLVHIENQYNATPTDATVLAQKLSFAVVAAGLGS